MLRYTVTGTVTCTLSIDVFANNEEEAIEKAGRQFEGVNSYAGNGGTDKLIGVDGENESIRCDDVPVWDDVVSSEEIESDYRYEVFDEDDVLIDEGDGYVDLSTAVEFAIENNGAYIKQVYYPIDDNGEIDIDDYTIISSEIVWERDNI